jgi:hypothetical protein
MNFMKILQPVFWDIAQSCLIVCSRMFMAAVYHIFKIHVYSELLIARLSPWIMSKDFVSNPEIRNAW